MKRLVLLSVVVAFTFVSPLFGSPSGNPSPPPPPPPPPFVEDNVPDGKALIYIYRVAGMGEFDPLVIAKTGPVKTLAMDTYIAYVTDPGTVKLWLVSLGTKELQIEAVAGQIYYITVGLNPPAFMGPAVPNLFFKCETKQRRQERNQQV